MDHESILKHPASPGERKYLSDGMVIQLNDYIHTLNETGADIYDLFDGSRSVKEVIDEVTRHYPHKDVRKPVEDFIKQLYEACLLIE